MAANLSGFCFYFKLTAGLRAFAAWLYYHLLTSPENLPTALRSLRFTLFPWVGTTSLWLQSWPSVCTFLCTFIHLKARRANCIIYQHFLGGHTFLFSPVWPTPAAICSLKHPRPSCVWQYTVVLQAEKWAVIEIWNSFCIYRVSSFLCFVCSNRFISTFIGFSLLVFFLPKKTHSKKSTRKLK